MPSEVLSELQRSGYHKYISVMPSSRWDGKELDC